MSRHSSQTRSKIAHICARPAFVKTEHSDDICHIGFATSRRFATSQIMMATREAFLERAAKLRLDDWVRVTLQNGSVIRGILYTADPETGHIVLLQPAAEGSSRPGVVTPQLLLAESIVQIHQYPSDAATALPLHAGPATLKRIEADGCDEPAEALFDSATVELRRQSLTTLLRSQRAPFEELSGGVLLILGCLRVVPPYTSRSCVCENEIVLDRFLEMCAANPLPTAPPDRSPDNRW